MFGFIIAEVLEHTAREIFDTLDINILAQPWQVEVGHQAVEEPDGQEERHLPAPDHHEFLGEQDSVKLVDEVTWNMKIFRKADNHRF